MSQIFKNGLYCTSANDQQLRTQQLKQNEHKKYETKYIFPTDTVNNKYFVPQKAWFTTVYSTSGIFQEPIIVCCGKEK